jgi:hypothetical protein
MGCPDVAVLFLYAVYSSARNNPVPAWGYRKMAKAFGLINAFALLAGTMSLVLWG